MPGANVVVTVWGRRHNLITSAFVILCALLIAVIIYTQPAKAPNPSVRYVSASLNGQMFNLELADTPDLRIKGLGNHPPLGEKEGMLFVFEYPGRECFWMKDMHFSIDILWFDASKRLVHQEREVSPSTYPHNFCPPLDALYVLELEAGSASELQLQTNDQLELKNL